MYQKQFYFEIVDAKVESFRNTTSAAFILLLTTGHVYAWRTWRQTRSGMPDCQAWSRNVMIWAASSWFSLKPIHILQERIIGFDYIENLADHVHPMAQKVLTIRNDFLQDDNFTIHTFQPTNRGLRSIIMKFDLLLHHNIRIALCLSQSSDLNIIEQLLSILETNLRPISSFLHHNLYRNFYNTFLSNYIPSALIQNFFYLISRIQAILHAKRGPTPC